MWVRQQRRQYKLLMEGRKSHITQERIDMLNSVGFVWVAKMNGTKNDAWLDNFEKLKKYRWSMEIVLFEMGMIFAFIGGLTTNASNTFI
mmetsp:Transcript_11877/g.17873  ORF Transcript_11877/g.17873 Transcript_11877/m.17873 type:complete len:89 (-) Transcript_11877:82-348(-)